MNAAPRRLDSWKEIARYLNRDLSTVRRWEKEKALPVHRVPGGTRHAVFAYTEEIDAWMQGNRNGLLQEDRPASPGRANRAVQIGVSVLILLAAFTAYSLAPGRARRLLRATFVGNQITAWDDQQRVVWSFPLEHPLLNLTAEQAAQRLRIMDLDGDNSPEVVAAVSYSESRNGNTAGDEIFCISSAGKLLWKYKPQITFKFAGKEFQGPWIINEWLPLGQQENGAIWVALSHSTWWPSFLVRLDQAGTQDVRFVNAGWITSLNFFEQGSSKFVLAGGVNNEYEAGFFAVLDAAGRPTTSPQTKGLPYYCESCTSEALEDYVLFPRSELNLLDSRPSNIVRLIRVFDTRIEVRAEEVADLYSIFEFTRNLEFRSVRMSDSYWDLHRLREKEGKLRHSFQYCRRRLLTLKLRVWSKNHGWQELRQAESFVTTGKLRATVQSK
jgi:hypothetical protein